MDDILTTTYIQSPHSPHRNKRKERRTTTKNKTVKQQHKLLNILLLWRVWDTQRYTEEMFYIY